MSLVEGAFGIVFRAFDTKLNRIVAIKVLAPEFSSNQMAVRRFSREAQAAAAVSHDHVVTLHAIEDQAKPPFIVMEYVEGESLGERLEREGPFETIEVLRIGMQIASGLEAAHQQGLVHRDIKPANILLENGIKRVQITDFGLARAVDDIGMTQTGTIAGTPEYMSPEQGLGRAVDARSDLFCLGSVLYALCTGRTPFRADSTVATLKRICDDQPRSICGVNSEIPDWLESLIFKLLEKDPEYRFQSAVEVEQVFKSCLAQIQSGKSTPKVAQLQNQNGQVASAGLRERPAFSGFLSVAIVFQLLAISGFYFLAFVEIETIALAGLVSGFGLGGIILGLCYWLKASRKQYAFGLISIVATLCIGALIAVLDLRPGDPLPVIVMLSLYTFAAIPLGIYALFDWSRASSNGALDLWHELKREEVFYTLMSVHILGLALTAALVAIENTSVFVTGPVFMVLLGTVLAAVVLPQKRHYLVRIFAAAGPLFALLILFSAVSYSFNVRTPVNSFNTWAFSILIILFSFVMVPIGFWGILREAKLTSTLQPNQVDLKFVLIFMAALGLAFGFARPSLGFGILAFAANTLLGLAVIGLASLLGYWFYLRNRRTIPLLQTFLIAVFSMAISVGYMGGIVAYDAEHNYVYLYLESDGNWANSLSKPLTIEVTLSNGQKTKHQFDGRTLFLGKPRIGNVEVQVLDEQYKIEPGKVTLDRYEGQRKVTIQPKDGITMLPPRLQIQ